MHLSEINIYPIKSLAGISLENSFVEDRGLQFDRRWMLINEKNEFLTQRQFPVMATINVEIKDKGLIVSQNGNERSVAFEPKTQITENVKI